MCGEEDISFVDNTTPFHLKDDFINDTYFLEDGTHLTFKATNKQARNLQLNMKDEINNVYETHQPKTLYTPVETTKKMGPPHKTRNSNMQETNEDFCHSFGTGSHYKENTEETCLENYHKESRDQNYGNYSIQYETRCYFCYEAHHTKKTCSHQQTIICNACGGEGHKVKHHAH